MFSYYIRVLEEFGVPYETDYPYKEDQGTCKRTTGNKKIVSHKFCSNYARYRDDFCSHTKFVILLEKGPVSIGVDASSADYAYYTSGIFTAQCQYDCHAIIAVGMTDTYINTRNSWGDG